MEQLARLLTKYGPVAVAESLTSGLVQDYFGEISGASKYYAGGITVYNLAQKVKHLNVDREHAFSVDCVSVRVAEEMAIGVCDLLGSEIGIGTTGYAEFPVDSDLPYGYYFIFFKSDPQNCIGGRLSKDLQRNEFRQWFVEQVMQKFKEALNHLEN
ncbi:MAG: CinA family protein [Bacteroidota bacterium]